MKQHRVASDDIVREFDDSLASSELALVKRARQFASEVVAPRAAEWQRGQLEPQATLREACTAGLATIELPASLGGQGMRFAAKLRIVEELAKADFGFAFALVNHHNALVRVAQADENTRARLLPGLLAGKHFGASAYTEPAHGSDLVQLETQADRVDGGWRVTGSKSWITGAAWADMFLTLVQTQPGAGAAGLALVLVEADQEGFYRDTPYEIVGGRTIGLGGFQLRDYFVPDAALLQPPGKALRAALEGINGARCYVAAMCAGMLESALDVAIEYTTRRRAFGQPTLEFQGLRWTLVDVATDLAALRLLTYRAARLISSDDPDLRKSAHAAAATAKKFAGDRTVHHLSNCVQTLGANGLREEYPLVRHLLAAKMAAFADGTTEMMNERLGKLLADRAAGA
jgi:alkylation response protein AidB-like acyl-CoA dehydrogenase